jgi:sulfate adenylyltransferase subunit 1 (EFTu-like GTPase family)
LGRITRFSRIIAGRIEAGCLRSGAEVSFLPGGRRTGIRSIEKYPGSAAKVCAGESVGVLTEDEIFTERGDIICLPGAEPLLTDRFRASIFWMSKGRLEAGERISIRCATQETTCRIKEIEKRIDSSSLEVIEEGATGLENLQVGEVIMETKKPIAICSFSEVPELGRFVLVRDENICAGGIISKTGGI